jgi:hypothetical protein
MSILKKQKYKIKNRAIKKYLICGEYINEKSSNHNFNFFNAHPKQCLR